MSLYYPNEPLLFYHIQSYKKQTPDFLHNSDTTDMIRNGLYILYDNSEMDDNVSDDEPVIMMMLKHLCLILNQQNCKIGW